MILAVFGNAMMDPRQTDAVYLLMCASILIVFGGGWLSLDRVAAVLLGRFLPPADRRDPRALEGLPRVEMCIRDR